MSWVGGPWERRRPAGGLDQFVVSRSRRDAGAPRKERTGSQNELGYERGLGIFPTRSQ